MVAREKKRECEAGEERQRKAKPEDEDQAEQQRRAGHAVGALILSYRQTLRGNKVLEACKALRAEGEERVSF